MNGHRNERRSEVPMSSRYLNRACEWITAITHHRTPIGMCVQKRPNGPEYSDAGRPCPAGAWASGRRPHRGRLGSQRGLTDVPAAIGCRVAGLLRGGGAPAKNPVKSVNSTRPHAGMWVQTGATLRGSRKRLSRGPIVRWLPETRHERSTPSLTLGYPVVQTNPGRSRSILAVRA